MRKPRSAPKSFIRALKKDREKRRALAIEARRAIDSEAGVVGDESAGPEDNAHD